MRLVTDTREQAALVFAEVRGVEYVREALPAGDYAAWHSDGRQDETVFERKSVADLFNSFTSGYEHERAKILRIKDMRLRYILAIEASATEVRKGHSYWQGGQMHEHRKTGMAMIKQLHTIMRKYGVEVWFCQGRVEMAWRIQEYFLAGERLIEQQAKEANADKEA